MSDVKMNNWRSIHPRKEQVGETPLTAPLAPVFGPLDRRVPLARTGR